jgi:hypothetical protein
VRLTAHQSENGNSLAGVLNDVYFLVKEAKTRLFKGAE